MKILVRDRRRVRWIEHTILKEFCNVKTLTELQDFHGRQKYLYFCYHVPTKNTLGVLASQGNFSAYEKELRNLFSHSRTKKKERNALQHMVGYLKKELSSEEKETFSKLIEDYEASKTSLGVLLSFLFHQATIHQKDYLLKQSIFRIGDIQ